jgi:hypothetical protein
MYYKLRVLKTRLRPTGLRERGAQLSNYGYGLSLEGLNEVKQGLVLHAEIHGAGGEHVAPDTHFILRE